MFMQDITNSGKMKINVLVSVIIPAYNEEENIRKAVNNVKKVMDETKWSYEIVIVNDGSKDRTEEIARKIKGINLVSYKPNRGKGYAVRKGVAIMNGRVGIIVDADMSINGISKVIEPVINKKAELSIGNRFQMKMEEGAMPKVHILGNRIFAFLASMMTGFRYWFYDLNCGFKAFTKKHFLNLSMQENSWPDIEIILKTANRGLKIVQVPIYYNKREKGKSKMKTFKHGYKMIREILRYGLINRQ